MQRWRYKVLVLREMHMSESKLNHEGERGWELISVCMADGTTGRAFLKKRWEDAEDEPVGEHELHHTA